MQSFSLYIIYDCDSDVIEDVMCTHDPEGFTICEPTAKRIHRTALVSIGPREFWSMDGHDKLNRIGFPVYGIQDVWTGKWLGLWTVPNNRLKNVITCLYLSLVEEYKGIFYFLCS
jgi:hypothetical protein